MLPSKGRLLYRTGKDYKTTTFGLYLGYLQTNLVVIPSDQVNDFKEFCRQNSGPCPLLFASSVGQTDAPSLAHGDYDVRTDLSTYEEYKAGVKSPEPLPDLLAKPWGDMVSCYLGCSYSFYDRLVGAGVTLPPSKNVAMFRTNIPCIPVGRFSCDMVVSMVPIPRLLLDEVVRVTGEAEYCHGAPVHIGSPGDIGIAPGLHPDFGEFITVPSDSIPCFWACGVTGSMAVKSAQLPVSYSHSPGCMFVSDIPNADVTSAMFPSPSYPPPTVLCLNPGLQHYSPVSRNTANKLLDIEQLCASDPGNRGIAHLLIPGDFSKACLHLSLSAGSVGILLGFPLFDGAPAEENDGVAGAVYLARGLQAIGAQVYFVLDETATELMSLLGECKERGFITSSSCITIGGVTNGLGALDGRGFTHLISIERVSPAADGKYYTMRGIDISGKVGPMGEVFRAATASADLTTIGIGDGGNELGMGKVRDQVVRHVPHGDVIAAAVSADYLVTCGVSNWGGLAVAAGLYALRACLVHDRYRRRARGVHTAPGLAEFLLDSEQDLELHELIARAGFRDGVNMVAGLTVDGLDYYSIHREMLLKLTKIVA